MSTVTAPPKKSNTTRTGTRQTSSRMQVQPQLTQAEKRASGLMGIAQLGQALCVMTGQYADAATIGKHAPAITNEVALLADSYDIVAGPVDFLIQVGPFGGILAAGLPFVLQIMANHGALDATRLSSQGVVPPAVLEAQMQAQVMRMQADMVAAQQKAVEEAQKARAELDSLLAAQAA